MKLSLLGTAAILWCVAAAVAAQYGPKVEPAAMSSKYNPLLWQGDDAKFALDTLESSYCTSQLSKLVAQQTGDSAVQNLAFTQAYDQRKIYEQLRGMAKTLNFHVPGRRELQECPATARLRELAGKELDSGYVSYIAANTTKNVARFEAETQMPRAPSNWSLWGFAQKTLPVIREDESSVKSLQRAMAPAADHQNSKSSNPPR